MPLRSACRGVERYSFPEAVDLQLVSAPRWPPERGLQQHALLWVGGKEGELWSINTVDEQPQWVRHDLPTDADLYGISMGEATMWLVGAGGTLIRRVEGSDWEVVPSPTGAHALRAIAWFPNAVGMGNRHVVVGDAGTLLDVSAEAHWRGDCQPPGFVD